jgi:hypothetical protein
MTNAVTRSETPPPSPQSFEIFGVKVTRTKVRDDAPAPPGTRFAAEPFKTSGEMLLLHCWAIAGAENAAAKARTRTPTTRLLHFGLLMDCPS